MPGSECNKGKEGLIYEGTFLNKQSRKDELHVNQNGIRLLMLKIEKVKWTFFKFEGKLAGEEGFGMLHPLDMKL